MQPMLTLGLLGEGGGAGLGTPLPNASCLRGWARALVAGTPGSWALCRQASVALEQMGKSAVVWTMWEFLEELGLELGRPFSVVISILPLMTLGLHISAQLCNLQASYVTSLSSVY